MSEEDVDFRTIGFEEGLHDFLAFLAGELTSLGSEDVVLACISCFSHCIFETFLTADSYGRTNRALKNYDIVLAAAITRGLFLFSHVLIDPFEDVVAFFDRVRTDFSNVEGIIAEFDIAVNNDNRNLRIFCFFEHRVPTGFNDRNESDDINALCNEGTDSLDLVLLFLLCIRELQVDTCIFSCLFDGFRIGRSPLGFRSDL